MFDKHLRPLQVLQNCVLKVIFNKPYLYSTDLLYEETGMFDIRQLFCFVLSYWQFMHRGEIETVDHCYTTRHLTDVNLRSIKAQKTVMHRSHSYLSSRVYNAIPSCFKKLNSVHLFKSKVREWICSTPSEQMHNLVNIKN